MALAIAMVACTAAAGKVGPAGPQGPKGDSGTTDPTTPTPDPTTPTVDNAMPMIAKTFDPVYLTVKGAGMKMNTPKLSEHITDDDSVLRFVLTSSVPTIASVEEKGSVWMIKAVKAGSATITVTAHDGANKSVSTPIAVTVVQENKAPTSNGLGGSDRKELEKRLYIADGHRTDTITIKTDAVGEGDEIVDYKYMVGKDDEGKDDNVDVVVTKGPGNTHIVVVTPKDSTSGVKALGAPDQMVKIYPKDMFDAEAKKAWTFMAEFNKPPMVLDDSFSIALNRPAVTAPPAAGTLVVLDDTNAATANAATVMIDRHFIATSLQRTPGVHASAGTLAVGEEDQNGDTNCEVSYSPKTLAAVQMLDETGATTEGEITSATALVKGDEALYGIRIDSRVSSFAAADGITDIGTGAKVATGTGTVTVTITCTDRDDSAVVTGKVVVRQL